MNNEERIGHLETKCKRLTLALSGMMVMAVAMLFIAAKPKADHDTIQTRKLDLSDYHLDPSLFPNGRNICPRHPTV